MVAPFECVNPIYAHQMTEALVDSSNLLPHIYSVSERKSADRLVENRDPDLQLGTGVSLIMISLLLLGFRAGIWAAVASSTSAVVG